MAFFARELQLPTFTDLSTNTLRSKSVKEYVEQMKARIKSVHEAVRAESKRQSEITAQAYNKNVKHTPLEQGELVYYKEIPKNRTKLDPKWVGPVEVAQRHTNAKGMPGTTYTLRFKDGATISRNYEQLKRVMAKLKEPINKAELPCAPAPRVSCRINYFSEEEQTPVSNSPIANRTRNRRAQPNQPVHQPPPPLVAPVMTQAPVLTPDSASQFAPTADDPDGTLMPVSSEEDSSGDYESPLSPNATFNASSMAFPPSDLDLSWDTAAETGNPMPAAHGPLSPIAQSLPDQAAPSEAELANLRSGGSSPRPTSSQATTPEPGLQTVIQVVPGEINSDIRTQADSIPPPQMPIPQRGRSGLDSSPQPGPSDKRLTIPPEVIAEYVPSSESDQDILESPKLGPDRGNLDASVVEMELGEVPSSPVAPTPDDEEDSPEPPDYEPRHGRTAAPVDMESGEIRSSLADPAADNNEDSPEPPNYEPCCGAAAASVSQDHNNSSPKSLDSLENFIDVIHGEMQFFQQMGDKHIDILRYREHDFRRNRLSERHKTTQRFICRHTGKFKSCKAKLKLTVTNFDNIVDGCIIEEYVPHDHEPYRAKSYAYSGAAELSDVFAAQGSDFSSIAEFSNPNEIVHIDTCQLSQDFEEENLNDIIKSTPAPPNRRLTLASHGEKAPSVEIVSLMVDTSQVDARGYRIRQNMKFQRKFKDIANWVPDDADADVESGQENAPEED